MLSRLASITGCLIDLFHLELDALFVYNITLIKIYPTLVARIFATYDVNARCSQFQYQVRANKDLASNSGLLPFMSSISLASNADFYLAPRPKENTRVLLQPNNLKMPWQLVILKEDLLLLPLDKAKLLYYVNKKTGIQYLGIPPSVALNILPVAHENRYPGFFYCYEIITLSWFIQGLIKMLWEFIRYCFKCFVLQIKRHLLNNSFLSIETSPVLFYSLTLDFILALFMASKKFYALILVRCKFSKHITLIKQIDI